MDNYAMLASGVLVPTTHMEGLQRAVELRERTVRGKFFTEYARLSTASPAGAQDKPPQTPSFRFLRQCGKDSIIDSLIIQTRVKQVRRVARPAWVPGKQPGFRVVHERHDDPRFEMTDQVHRRCLEVQRRLERVTPEVHNTFQDFLGICVEEELTIGRKAMVVFRDAENKPTQFHLLPADTIKPRVELLMPYMVRTGMTDEEQAARRYQDEVLKNPDVDLTDAAWVQEIEGRVVAAWTRDELAVDNANPTIEVDRVLYGRSTLELSLRTTATFMHIWRYNDELFRTNMPEGIVILYGDYFPDGFESFKRQMLGDQSEGGSWRLPVLLAGPQTEGIKGEFLKVRDTPREMTFLELLILTINLKCGAYRMHPSTINVGQAGQPDALILQVDEEQSIGLAQEEGLHGLLDSLASFLTRNIVKPNYADLIMIWDGLQKEPPLQRVQTLVTKMAYATLNEIRAQDDLPPLPSEAGGDIILNPTYLQAVQMQAGMQQQQEGGGQPGGAPGEDQGQGGAPSQNGSAAGPPGNQAPPGAPNGSAPGGRELLQRLQAEGASGAAGPPGGR